MLKKALFICFILSSFISSSQEIVKEFNLKLARKRNFFQVTNENSKEVILFLNDKEKVSSIRFDNKFEIKDSISTLRPEKKYTEIIGYSQKDQNYFLFWGSKDRNDINVQSFNFLTKETQAKPITLELKKEKVIKEITINNTFYLISIVKNSSILKFYTSDENGNLNEKMVDLTKFQFRNKDGQNVNLYNVLFEV